MNEKKLTQKHKAKLLFSLIVNIYPPIKDEYQDPLILKFNENDSYFLRIDKRKTDYINLLNLDNNKYKLYILENDLTKNELVIDANYLKYLYNSFIKYTNKDLREYLGSRLERFY